MFAGVEYADWPAWAKGKLKRCRVPTHGAAAISVGAAARGVRVPRGAATSQLAGQLGLAASTWDLIWQARHQIPRRALHK